MSVKSILHDNTPALQQRMAINTSLAVKRLLDDVKRQSRPKTPFSGTGGGHLRDSVLTQVRGTRGEIRWNKAYAAYQERGKRASGTHQVRHYTTPGTGKKFAENTIRKIKVLPYFRNVL